MTTYRGKGALDERQLSVVFRALADATRQDILRLLETRQSTIDEIVESLWRPRPTISRHLAVLKEAGLVVEQQLGSLHLYALNAGVLADSLRGVFAQFRSIRGAIRASSGGAAANESDVVLVSAVSQLRAALGKNLELIYQITAEQLELLVCDRLDAMGFDVRQVGHTFAADGGVDIVSWPKKSTFPYLIGVQVKHRRKPTGRIGPAPVRDLLGVLQSSPFDAGVLVTNTSFTPDARWFAQHSSRLVRLRDLEDLRRWIAGNFLTEDLRDLPDEIELAPGIRISLR